MEWHIAASQYLARLGRDEYEQQKREAKGKRFRYCPSEYHRTLVALLGRNDENGFKAIKMLQGYASATGV